MLATWHRGPLLGFQSFYLYILKEFLQGIISILLFHLSNLGTENHVS
jgi:hypothetical protein